MMISQSGALRQDFRAHFSVSLIPIVFGVFLALSIHARAGEPGKTIPDLSQTPLELKPYATAIGQRLQKPGRERITATGTILYQTDSLQQAEPLRVTWQHPLKIRLEQGGKGQTFDRNNPSQSSHGNQTPLDTVQMLLEDSIEGFFALQKGRIARRYLGSGFILEGAKETDPAVDIVQMTFPDTFRQGQPILKSYWFNSRTKLLGVVAYKSTSGVLTHIVIDDWRDVEGEKIPFRIERWENNKLAMQLTLDSATISAGTDDGSLGGN